MVEFLQKLPSVAVAIVSTAVACIAGFIGYLGYKRKSGLRLRGNYITTSTIACDDDFVSRVTLENMKDRAITIFGIYLRLGFNVYVIVEEFGAHPLVLKPFETYQHDYDPIEFYAVSSKRVRINALLKDGKVRKRLVLSTGDGKYTVRRYVRRWDPVHTFFRNYMTAIVQPIRSTFKGKAYGANAIFLVELKLPDGNEQMIPLYPDDYQIRRFRNVRLTEESLKSKSALEELLNGERNAGNLEARSIRVYGLKEMRNERFELYGKRVIDVARVSAFLYYVVGPLWARVSNWRMRRQNRRLARKSEPQKTSSS